MPAGPRQPRLPLAAAARSAAPKGLGAVTAGGGGGPSPLEGKGALVALTQPATGWKEARTALQRLSKAAEISQARVG